MGEVIEALKSSNLRDKVRVMVGGAPVTQDFADSIGADGYAPDAVLALDKAKQLLG
jgi:5-methyltetrahydrofolate--homocysteine methyltransferase